MPDRKVRRFDKLTALSKVEGLRDAEKSGQ
jgi:hypothetical protein